MTRAWHPQSEQVCVIVACGARFMPEARNQKRCRVCITENRKPPLKGHPGDLPHDHPRYLAWREQRHEVGRSRSARYQATVAWRLDPAQYWAGVIGRAEIAKRRRGYDERGRVRA